MSTYKHLADLLKLCSVLPALAIMPAMATTVDISSDTVIENQTNSVSTNQNAAGLTLSYGDKLSADGANNVVFKNNSSVNSGGAMKALNGFVAGDGWTFEGNHSDKMSGGLYVKIPESYTGVDPENINRDVVFGKNTTFTGNSSTWLGGALGIETARNVTIGDNAKFTNNSTEADGGAIAIWTDSTNGVKTPSTLTLGTSEFTGNTAANRGGAIANLNSDNNPTEFNNTVNIATSTFENNSAKNGGAIYNVGTMNVGGTFTGNKATSQGGAVWNSGTLNIADGSVFDGNDAGYGGAIYNTGVLTVGDNVAFKNNESDSAVHVAIKGSATFGDNVQFIGNITKNGALRLSSSNSGAVEIGKNAVFQDNTATLSGGALRTYGPNVLKIADGANFERNTSANYGGAIYLVSNNIDFGSGFSFTENESNRGGAIYFASAADFDMNGWEFTGNKANSTDDSAGGALFVGKATGTIDINNSTFTKNTSTVAGGAIGYVDGSTVEMTIDGSTFAQNQTGAEGGAVVSDATLVVKNSTFTGNKTTGTKVVETGKPVLDANGGGGAIFLYDESNTTISGSTFTGNESGTYGGAISTRMGADSEVSSLTLSDSEFKTNIAKANGGAIFNTVKTTIGDGMLFEDNNANNGGAIWNEQGATLSFANTKLVEFKHNVAGNAGGAIYNAGVIDKISHVSFQKNEGKLAGAINNSNLIGKNQGGYIGEISNSSFIDNNAGTSQGGAIRNQGKIDKIADVLFSGNRSGNGGALNNGTWGSVAGSITDVEFSGNVAEGGKGQGGAIVNAGNIALIDDSEFNSNRADKIGGAIANVDPEDGDGTAIATITLKNTDFTGNKAGEQGGAIYNKERGKIVLDGENLFSGNTAAGVANDIHNEGALVISGGVTKLDGGITGTGNLTIKDGATLSIGTTSIQQSEIELNGTLAAQIVNEKSFAKIQTENIVVGEKGVLDLMLGSVGTYNIGVMVPEAKIAYNDSVYNVKFNKDNNMVVSLKSVDEIAENNGVSSNAAAVLTGLMSSQDDTLNIAALNVQEALARGDTEYVETGTAKLLPQDKPVAQSVATSVQNQVLSVATNRMSGAMVAGRNGGDFASAEYGVWAQGLYNHSKYADEFTGDTMGIAVGADALIADKYTIGIGYAYNESDVEAKNDVDITSNSLFVYGQYKPNQWYVNGTLNYTMSNYTNKVAAFGIVHDEEYDVDSFGGQLMGGYDMAFGLTPEAGVRYLHIAQDGYNSVLGAVSDASYDYLTGVIGAKYAFTIESGSDWLFRPELRAAATYDFMSDESIATVDIPGVGSYVMPGERLSRFGGEFGIGLAALYNGWEISVNYDLDLHQDYTSHTGMLKFRYDF